MVASMLYVLLCFFFNDPATPAIYTYLHTLSLHDALPIYRTIRQRSKLDSEFGLPEQPCPAAESVRNVPPPYRAYPGSRSWPAHRNQDRKSTRLNSSH